MNDNYSTNRSGSNKVIIFLLAGGVIILLITSGIIYMRNQQKNETTEKSEKIAPQEYLQAPAPLVVSEKAKPIESVQNNDAKVDEKESDNTIEAKTNGTGKTGKKRREPVSAKMGTIDSAAVKKYINAHFNQVRSCYERRLKTNPMLQGMIDLRITLSTSGKAVAIGINRDTLGDSEMIRCMKIVIKKWNFPKPKGGRVIFDKPFRFKKKF